MRANHSNNTDITTQYQGPDLQRFVSQSYELRRTYEKRKTTNLQNL